MKINYNNQQNFNGILGSKPTERTVNLLMQELGLKKTKEITFKYYNNINPRMADDFRSLYNTRITADRKRILFNDYSESKKMEYISFAMQEFLHRLIPENLREMQPKKWFHLKHQYTIPFEEIRKFADTVKGANKLELHQMIKKANKSLACFVGKVMENILQN